MKTQKVKISKLQENPDNPRLLTEDKGRKLQKSIKDFPEMLTARPIVVNKDMTILGGNMRYKALLATGVEEIEVMIVDWSEEKQQEFIIKDNVGYGQWDWDMLANQFDAYQLNEWALDIDPNMFNIDSDDESMQEATDTTKFNDYTIYFANEQQMDIWYAFLRKLKNKFGDYNNVSQRVLAYIADVYEDNQMKESEMILKFIEYDVDEE